MVSIVGYDCVWDYIIVTAGCPSWLEIDTVRDVTMNLERNEVDDTSRTAQGWRSRLAGLAQWGADFEMIYNTESTPWQKVRESFFLNTSIEVLILDGDITIDDKEGLRGTVFVTNFERSEPLEEAVTNATTFVGSGTPQWVKSSGGVVVPVDGS